MSCASRARVYRAEAESDRERSRGGPAIQDGHRSLLRRPHTLRAWGHVADCLGEPVFNLPAAASGGGTVNQSFGLVNSSSRSCVTRQPSVRAGVHAQRRGRPGSTLAGLVRPGHVVRHVHSPAAQLQHRLDVRAQRIADHDELAAARHELAATRARRSPRPSPTRFRCAGTGRPARTRHLRFLVEQVALGDQHDRAFGGDRATASRMPGQQFDRVVQDRPCPAARCDAGRPRRYARR